MIKEIYSVYADDLPSSRSLYSATTKSPVAMREITKKYKTWEKFVAEYTKYAILKRNVKPVLVTKAKVGIPNATKK